MELESVYNVLFVIAVGLLLFVSGGVFYLTSLQWRDRRRRERDKRL
ncbi:MAG: hypothetical protein NZ901_06005 [Geminocystis sp.]|nr:hypothetical protein [Geminocystis sp.]MCS7147731.1 hypothetical protein [Geminocystis sp.]MDW8116695.1 hypothetical protein [Geminocystis sp.]MDW8463900.1 hypothetical protein [Geminocystis sp.]